MRQTLVKDLMVPLSRCAKTSPETTLLAAAMELKANNGEAACLVVMDSAGDVRGVFEPIDYLRGLEPKYLQEDLFAGMADAHYFGELARETVRSLGLFDGPMEHLCKLSAARKVDEFVRPLAKNQTVAAQDSLDVAIHQMVMTGRQVLVVQDNGKPAGVLKLSDVFKAVLQAAKTCPTA